MYAKVREHGAPVQGARLERKERFVELPTHDAYLRFGRDGKYRAALHLGVGGSGWTEPAQQQQLGFLWRV
jgi:hypothetical protein